MDENEQKQIVLFLVNHTWVFYEKVNWASIDVLGNVEEYNMMYLF